MHPNLFQQHHFFVVFADAAFDHFFDDRLRLAGSARLIGQHVAFARKRRGIHGGNIHSFRAGGGDMHADLPTKRFHHR